MEASTSESMSSRSKPTFRVAVSLKIPDCSSDDEVDSLRPKSCPHSARGRRGGSLPCEKLMLTLGFGSLSSTVDDTSMIKEKELSLMRNQSNVELLTTPQRDQFDAFVSDTMPRGWHLPCR